MFGSMIARIKRAFGGRTNDRASTAPTEVTFVNSQPSGRTTQIPVHHHHSSFSTPDPRAAAQPPGFMPAALTAGMTEGSEDSAAFMQRKAKFMDLVPVLGHPPLDKFCSRKWQERVEGLDSVGRLLRSKAHAKRVMADWQGIEELFAATLSLVSRALDDSVTPVYFACIDLINVCIEAALPDDVLKVHNSIAPLLPGLVRWSSVSNARVQEKTLRCITDMASNKKIGSRLIAPYVVQQPETHTAVVYQSRMTMLAALLPQAGISRTGFTVPGVMSLVNKAFETKDEKVIKAGVVVAAEVYRCSGKEVLPFTRHLPAEVIRLLDEKFVAIDKAKNAKPDDPASMEDDPLWLLRIQKAGGDRATDSKAAPQSSSHTGGGSGGGGAGYSSRPTSTNSTRSGAGAGAGAGIASAPFSTGGASMRNRVVSRKDWQSVAAPETTTGPSAAQGGGFGGGGYSALSRGGIGGGAGTGMPAFKPSTRAIPGATSGAVTSGYKPSSRVSSAGRPPIGARVEKPASSAPRSVFASSAASTMGMPKKPVVSKPAAPESDSFLPTLERPRHSLNATDEALMDDILGDF